jgi:cellulose synthase/poly-beta-1,6-N-acetylglucosamine synthase-like glycosyltransferase
MSPIDRLWRYTRLIVNIIAAWTTKPILPPRKPTLTSSDVTVVIPTLGENKEFQECVQTINACNPAAITVVTPEKNVGRVRNTLEKLGLYKVNVLGAKKANKRLQMVQGLKESKTAITIFADDDVFWGTSFITYLLAPFEDPKVGAVGGFTSSSRTENLNGWEFLGTAYLERWNFEIAATSHMDGGIPCLSGRTAAIRTEIVQDPGFIDEFVGEKWIGRISLLSADDDNCITRWLVNRGWKTKIQTAEEARLTTAVEPDSAFLGQCVRWCRTTWRSNFTSMFLDKVIWR